MRVVFIYWSSATSRNKSCGIGTYYVTNKKKFIFISYQRIKMKIIFLAFCVCMILVGCGYQKASPMGEFVYNNYFKMCALSNMVTERFTSYSDINKYCGCRAYYISQNVTFPEYRDMINAEFETGLTRVSARVLNNAELYCNKKQ